MLLRDALERLLARGWHALSTARGYRESVVRLERWGIETSEQATPESVSRLQERLLAEGWKPSSIVNHVIVLRAILRPLDEEGLLAPGQYAGMRRVQLRPPRPERRHRVRFLTRLELERLASGAAEHAPRLELPIRVAALSGLRVGELSHSKPVAVAESPSSARTFASRTAVPATRPAA